MRYEPIQLQEFEPRFRSALAERADWKRVFDAALRGVDHATSAGDVAIRDRQRDIAREAWLHIADGCADEDFRKTMTTIIDRWSGSNKKKKEDSTMRKEAQSATKNSPQMGAFSFFGPVNIFGSSVLLKTLRPSGRSAEFNNGWDEFGIATAAALDGGFDPAGVTAGIDILADLRGGDYGAGLLAHAAAYRDMLSMAAAAIVEGDHHDFDF